MWTEAEMDHMSEDFDAGKIDTGFGDMPTEEEGGEERWQR